MGLRALRLALRVRACVRLAWPNRLAFRTVNVSNTYRKTLPAYTVRLHVYRVVRALDGYRAETI
jgi:hypothetical protein